MPAGKRAYPSRPRRTGLGQAAQKCCRRSRRLLTSLLKAADETARPIPSRSTASVFDGSRYQYGGVLKGLWVDISAGEFRDGRRRSLIARRLHHVDHDPRTLRSRLADATTNVWSEANGKGGYPYPYLATVKTFIGPEGKDQPFAEKTVHGEIARSWI